MSFVGWKVDGHPSFLSRVSVTSVPLTKSSSPLSSSPLTRRTSSYIAGHNLLSYHHHSGKRQREIESKTSESITTLHQSRLIPRATGDSVLKQVSLVHSPPNLKSHAVNVVSSYWNIPGWFSVQGTTNTPCQDSICHDEYWPSTLVGRRNNVATNPWLHCGGATNAVGKATCWWSESRKGQGYAIGLFELVLCRSWAIRSCSLWWQGEDSNVWQNNDHFCFPDRKILTLSRLYRQSQEGRVMILETSPTWAKPFVSCILRNVLSTFTAYLLRVLTGCCRRYSIR